MYLFSILMIFNSVVAQVNLQSKAPGQIPPSHQHQLELALEERDKRCNIVPPTLKSQTQSRKIQ